MSLFRVIATRIPVFYRCGMSDVDVLDSIEEFFYAFL